MKYKSFSTITEPLSALGFGCWGLSGGGSWTQGDDETAIQTVRAAITAGINFFDVAPIYGRGHAETTLGKAIAGHRDEVFIASKCGMIWDDADNVTLNLSRRSIIEEVERSLRRLNVDHLDLYQMHWPDLDTRAPIEESFDAMALLKEQGKIRYVGLTNFSHADTALGIETYGLDCYQGLYNLLEHNPSRYHNIALAYRSRGEMLPLCRDNGVPFLPYSPIMQGLLTDHFDPTSWSADDVRQPNPKFHGDLWVAYADLAEAVRAVASEIGMPVVHLALNWLIGQDGVGPVICGGIEPDHVAQNLGALEWELSANMRDHLEQLVAPALARFEAEDAGDA